MGVSDTRAEPGREGMPASAGTANGVVGWVELERPLTGTGGGAAGAAVDARGAARISGAVFRMIAGSSASRSMRTGVGLGFEPLDFPPLRSSPAPFRRL